MEEQVSEVTIQKEISLYKETLSSYFLYPGLNLSELYSPHLFNTYVFNEDCKELVDPHLHIVFKFNGRFNARDGSAINHPYLSLENLLRKHQYYVADYDVRDGEYVVFIMTYPPIFIDDYNRFIEGSYSKFSDELKFIITGTDKTSNNYKILNKSEELREYWNKKMNVPGSKASVFIPQGGEVWTRPSRKEETFSEDKLNVKGYPRVY